jgi:hypothetical protein
MNYSHTSCGGKYKVPMPVKSAAALGIEMHRTGFVGGTETGWARARQLVKCDYVSYRTIKTMKAWYARHTYTSYPGYKKWVSEGRPKIPHANTKNRYRGAVAWLIWGGDPAKNWVMSIKTQ